MANMPHRVVILQHPREKKEPLATAPLLTEVLGAERVLVRPGLSWPNLAKALGISAEPGQPGPDARRWAVLYLGARAAGKTLPRPAEGTVAAYWVSAKNEFVPPTPEELKSLTGLMVIDGTWAQAKTLWWRNPWLLKLRRLVIIPGPGKTSTYSRVRREPRREAMSTLESVAMALTAMGESPATETALLSRLEKLIQENPAPASGGSGSGHRRHRRRRGPKGPRRPPEKSS
ncbi:MAG TPA: tRNA-uridine aminocarboxypropyltransferase [Bdellovibrionota bacterium]|jgi:DTW domain-containing protein YfiP|nr:tRNA-uridine aminocarboxypropyltransferase [Bdellovibrionota bacterium]